MDSRAALKLGLETAQMVAMAYLGDMTDEELMMRPHVSCNHVNWQVGHLIAAEHEMMSNIAPGAMPDVPEGFAAKYSKEAAASDDPSAFATKEELMAACKSQREGTLAVLENLTDSQLDEESGVHFAPTKASIVNMQSAHWLMHCGQWVIVRRMASKPVVI